MNKAELITELGTIYDQVGNPVKQRSEGNVESYVINCFLIGANDIMERRSNYFYVVDEGLPGEIAYYAAHEPEQPPPGNQFVRDVKTFIASKISDGTIEAAYLTAVDETNETAVAVAYQVAGTLEKKEGLFWRDGNGDIQLRVVGT